MNEVFKIYAAARCGGAEKDLVAFYPSALETAGESLRVTSQPGLQSESQKPNNTNKHRRPGGLEYKREYSRDTFRVF